MKIKEIINKDIYLIAVILLAAFLPLILYYIIGGNLFYDSFSYFNYALALAGFKNFTTVAYANLPPLVPFILSLFIRAGVTETWPFFVVDYIFYSLTILSFYFLLKLIISKKYAFLGTIILIFNPIILMSLFRGLVDIPLLFLTILSFYILILGFKKNSNALYFLFPVLALLFLTKFIGVLIVIPILFYLFIQWRENKLNRDKLKKIAIGILGAFLIIIPHMIYSYWAYKNFIPYLWQIQETFFSSDSAVVVRAETLDGGSYSRIQVISSIPYYFIGISNFKNIISSSYIILTILSIIGLLSSFIKNIKNAKKMQKTAQKTGLSHKTLPKDNKNNLTKSKTKIGNLIANLIDKLTPKNLKIQKSILISFIIIGILIYGIEFYNRSQYSPLIVLLFIFIALYAYLKKFSRIKIKNIDLLMVLWFLTILTFYSLYFVKVDRYMLPMFPPLIYFILKGLEKFFILVRTYFKNRSCSNIIESKLEYTRKTKLKSTTNISSRFLKVFTFENIILILTCLLIIGNGLGQEYVSSEKATHYENYQIDDIGNWLINHDSSFKGKKIWGDPNGQFYGWYLKTPIKATFYSNHSRLESHLNSQKVEYYITTTENLQKYNFTRFENFSSTDLGRMQIFYKINSYQ
ncbi:MAG: ArnT family glycosyltransferase [Methanobacteriaceae archaeon]